MATGVNNPIDVVNELHNDPAEQQMFEADYIFELYVQTEVNKIIIEALKRESLPIEIDVVDLGKAMMTIFGNDTLITLKQSFPSVEAKKIYQNICKSLDTIFSSTGYDIKSQPNIFVNFERIYASINLET